jgi:ribonuclease HII
MTFFIGVDEVGIGAYAGPAYVCAAVVIDAWEPPRGLKDSKKMSWVAKKRVYAELLETITDQRIISIPNTHIDKIGLGKAWIEAVTMALQPLVELYPNYNLTIDGDRMPPGFKGTALPRADNLVPVVSAASVIAKVNRDSLMIQLHEQYPYYDWRSNMGYGTPNHWRGLHRHGVSPLHRRSFSPIKQLLIRKPTGDFPK